MKCGVIDIGSNAIRAVIYENELLSSPVVFHKKFKCGLKEFLDLPKDSKSSQIYEIIDYITYYFKQNNVIKVKCVATEVLRKHNKTIDFIKTIKSKFNLDIEVISGNQEAILTAKGLILGAKNVNGLAADLGGGSLEVIEINNDIINKAISLPYGTKTNYMEYSLENAFKEISLEFNNDYFENLYLIGGTFRLIGRLYLHVMQKHIKILHNITIHVSFFQNFLELVFNDVKINISDAQKNAIKIINLILEKYNIKNIIISSYGLKEGVRFDYLLNENTKNIIHERCSIITGVNFNSENLQKYFKILKNLNIDNVENIREILFYTIMFAIFYHKCGNSIGGIFTYDFIINIDIPFTEKERIIIAAALSVIFLKNIPNNLKKLTKHYLCTKDFTVVNIIGNFVKICLEIQGNLIITPNFILNKNDKLIEVESDFNIPNVIIYKIKNNLKELSFFIRKHNFAKY